MEPVSVVGTRIAHALSEVSAGQGLFVIMIIIDCLWHYVW